MFQKRTSLYALLALYEIADQHRGGESSRSIRVRDIASKYKLPGAYMAKIMSQLAEAEILHSDRGPRGGYRLDRSAKDISLYDIFEGVGSINALDTGSKQMKGIPRPVKVSMNGAMEDIDESVKKLLGGRTLADLLKSK